MTRRLLALALLAPACYAKADLPARVDCVDDCTSSSGAPEESSSEGDDGSGVTVVTSDPTTSPTSSPSTTASDDESSSGAPAEETGDAESTGAPADNLYSPCTSDDDCTSGFCAGGFCSQECDETPCPPAAGDAAGVTITCGNIGHVGASHLCEVCPECPRYCIPLCDETSTCPGGGYCMFNLCFDEGSYCGIAGGEYDDVSCSDGFDNDEDGYSDCDDFDCSMSETVTVCGSENTDVSCGDGLDNDEDGYVDCDDFDCSMNPGVTVCP